MEIHKNVGEIKGVDMKRQRDQTKIQPSLTRQTRKKNAKRKRRRKNRKKKQCKQKNVNKKT